MSQLLAADIGGTKTLLALAEADGGKPGILREARYENAQFPSFEAILADFLGAPAQPVAAACLAVAGPIDGRQARLTNLPWLVDADALEKRFGFGRAQLINDFVAVGYGIEALGPDDLFTLQAGKPLLHAPRAVLGAGTGLGECILNWSGDHYEVIASEGGHVDFAPTDELQIELLRFYMRRLGPVSYELILSGSGLVRLYEFLREHGVAAESPRVASAMESGDPAAAISAAALDGDPLSRRALGLFVSIYGAQAGNLALTCMARGGVFIAGGIAPKIIGKLRESNFLQAFAAKGKLAWVMGDMPVHVVKNEKTGLLGAIQYASRMMGS